MLYGNQELKFWKSGLLFDSVDSASYFVSDQKDLNLATLGKSSPAPGLGRLALAPAARPELA